MELVRTEDHPIRVCYAGPPDARAIRAKCGLTRQQSATRPGQFIHEAGGNDLRSIVIWLNAKSLKSFQAVPHRFEGLR